MREAQFEYLELPAQAPDMGDRDHQYTAEEHAKRKEPISDEQIAAVLKDIPLNDLERHAQERMQYLKDNQYPIEHMLIKNTLRNARQVKAEIEIIKDRGVHFNSEEYTQYIIDTYQVELQNQVIDAQAL